MEDQFNVSFHNADARSHDFYEFLQEHYKALKYIVLCCGKTDNEELAHEITKFLRHRDRKIPVYCLTKD